MDHAAAKNKGQLAAVAPPSTATAEAAKTKKPTTLLDAYEVECIRRELERLILRQNQISPAVGTAATDAHGRHRRRHSGVKKAPATASSAAKKASTSTTPAQAAAAKKGGVRLLGRHAVAICSGTVPVSAGGAVVGGDRRRRRGGYREVEKV